MPPITRPSCRIGKPPPKHTMRGRIGMPARTAGEWGGKRLGPGRGAMGGRGNRCGGRLPMHHVLCDSESHQVNTDRKASFSVRS
jgi:hypothetical protein